MKLDNCVAQVNYNFQRHVGDIEKALKLNFQILINCLKMDRATLYLLEEKEELIYPKLIMTVRGEMEAAGVVSVKENPENLFCKAILSGRTVVSPKYPEFGVYIPLDGEGKRVGILRIDNFLSGKDVTPGKVREIERFKEAFYRGISNCLTYQNFHNQIKKLTTLMRIAGVMTIALKLDEILKITLTSLVKDMGYDRAQVFLVDDESGMISRHVSYDFRDRFLSRAFGAGQAELGPFSSEHDPASLSRKHSSGVVCYTPMYWKGKKIGMLIVDNLFSREIFRPDDLSFLGILANQLGILIENSLLFEKVEQSSITDGLTGLYNHRQFYQLLSEEIARADRGRNKLSLLILDIDHFKNFNDTYGHQAGDKTLMLIADTMRRSIRAIDIAFRYGGEEFAVILPGADALHSRMIAERIGDNIRKAELGLGVKSVKGTTVSIGIATYPDDSAEKSDLVKKADQALYWSKEHGRDMITVFSRKINR